MPDSASRVTHLVTEAFWIVVGRPPTDRELRDECRGFDSERLRVLLMRLLSSPEFRNLRQCWKEVRPVSDSAAYERGLQSLGADEVFLEAAYRCLLGRPADEGGIRHYGGALAAGDTRASVIRSLATSDEFERRFQETAPEQGVAPRDVQLCELANPAKWDNPEWIAILRSLGLSEDRQSMHRKPYEFTQFIYGCRRLGELTSGSRVVSIGAGHELILYWLANQVGQVVATDLYEGVWQQVQGREGDPDVIRRPEEYAPFPYRQDRLVFMKMDGRRLAFRDNAFDVVYSLSSIEHFGGLDGAAATVREMGRVVKPGGLVVIATEYVLKGPPHEETFQPEEFASLIRQPELALVEPFDDRVYRRYDYSAIDLYKNPYQSPHMVVRFDDTVFTTAMVFLRKAIV